MKTGDGIWKVPITDICTKFQGNSSKLLRYFSLNQRHILILRHFAVSTVVMTLGWIRGIEI